MSYSVELSMKKFNNLGAGSYKDNQQATVVEKE